MCIRDSNIIDGILVITPPGNYFGEILVTVTVSDGVFDINQIFILTVISINDSPILSPILNQSVLEDTELVIEIIASDPDGDDITFITENTGNAFVSITDNYIHLIPEQNFNGEFGVLVSVSDGELINSTEFSVNVLPINDPPELIGEIQDITVFENSEDIEVPLSEIFYDVENGSDLAYSVSENIEGLTVNVAGTVLILSFIEGIYGSGIVEITASDNISRTTVSTSFNVEIIPDSADIAGCMDDSACNYNPEATVDDGTCEYPEANYDCDVMNDPPVLTPIGNQFIEEDNSLDVFLIASDSDGDYLTYAVVANGGMNTSLSNNILTIIPPTNYNGETNITVSVSDGEYIDSTDFTLTVNAVNDAPIVLQLLEDISLIEDTEAAMMVLLLSLIHISEPTRPY